MRRALAVLVAMIAAAAPLAAQAAEVQKVPLRVIARGQGPTVVVDRGKRENLQRGDMVTFRPIAGGSFRGVIVTVKSRTSVVGLQDPKAKLPPGTRGEAEVPKSRLKKKPDPKKPDPKKPGPGEKGAPQKPAPDKSKWRNKDDTWKPGMPLLGAMRPVRPSERAPRLSGRVFTIGEVTRVRDDDYDNSYLRAGASVLYENPFGRGGGIRFDGEFDHRYELNDKMGVDLLVRTLSYYWGGTRFDESRWEVGRFLQHGVPELQVLDGVEWSRRSKNGDRYGASAGLMPEPDDDFDTGQDFQLALYYEWVFGQEEELTITAAFQKTFHNSNSDRDLVIGKWRYLPEDGWAFQGSLWIDFYNGPDNVKTSDLEVTQAWVSLSRSWESGNGMDVTYRRTLFPEILRNEFRPLLANQVRDGYYDHLSVRGWLQQKDGDRLHGGGGVWKDQDDSGGFVEAGIDMPDFLIDGTRTDLTAFGTIGRFSTDGGLRLNCGEQTLKGGWDVFYEIAYRHITGFPSNINDIIQHRVRASRTYRMESGWECNLFVQGHLFDDDLAWTLGFYLQRGL